MSAGIKAGGMQINRLALPLMLRLTDYLRANYAQSKLDDVEFAKQAAQALGFPIESANIKTARQALGLPSNFKVNAALNKEKLAARSAVAKPEGLNLVLDELHSLNVAIAKLTARLDTYFAAR